MEIHNLDLGQHFMHDDAILDKIVREAHIRSSESILEIGLGDGALTKRILACNPSEFNVIEIDERLITDLPVEVHYGDALELISAFSFDKLVANLPYHILEPLFIKLLTNKPKEIDVVVSLPFAEKLQSETIIGIIYCQFYSVKELAQIPRSVFTPPPKVDSAFIQLRLKENISLNEFRRQFYFAQTKKVKNYFEIITKQTHTKKQIAREIETLGESLLHKKLYALSTEEFLILDAFYEQITNTIKVGKHL